MVRCPHKVFPEENKHRADVQYGGAVDIWAVGVLVVELVGGESPFKGARTGHSSRAQWEGGAALWFIAQVNRLLHTAASGQLS